MCCYDSYSNPEVQMKNPNGDLPYLSSAWDQKWKWPFTFISDLIEVEAWQILIPDQDPRIPTPFATARLTIRRNGNIVLNESIDQPMFATDAFLLLQVFTLSTMPGYKHPELQPIMDKFCRSFETFEEPTAIYWSKPGEDPLFD